jgi:hypothetical protein
MAALAITVEEGRQAAAVAVQMADQVVRGVELFRRGKMAVAEITGLAVVGVEALATSLLGVDEASAKPAASP